MGGNMKAAVFDEKNLWVVEDLLDPGPVASRRWN